MKSAGKLLREAREERGLTLDDVAAMTRVPKVMLEHLEQDRHEEYVADVFARGHLRSYAREMQLDPDRVIEAYERQTGRRRSDPLQKAKQEGRIAPEGSSAKKVPSATSGSSPSVDENEGGWPGGGAKAAKWGGFGTQIRRTHLVAVVLVLVGLFLMLGYLSNTRATAQDPVEYQEAEEAEWELDDDVQETRWLLEQNADEE